MYTLSDAQKYCTPGHTFVITRKLNRGIQVIHGLERNKKEEKRKAERQRKERMRMEGKNIRIKSEKIT